MAKKKSDAAKAIQRFARTRVDAFEPEVRPTSEALMKRITTAVDQKNTAQQRLDGWNNIITGAGVAGMDRRMVGQANWTGIMVESKAEQIYASGELERRIVELIPRECLKNWIKFTGLEGAETDVEDELDRLKASAKFYEASCWANIYGGAALFMATGEDPEDFKEPLDPKNFDKVESLVLFSRWELLVKSTDLENDINNPNYGQPKYYWLTPRKGNVSNLFSVRIHHSRLIIFGGKPLPLRLKVFNRYWDDSIYSGVIEVLRDYGLSHASIASVLQEFRQVIYKIKELSEGLGSIDGDSIKKRLAIAHTVKSVFGMFVLDTDEEMEIVSDTFTGVDGMLQALKERMQACTNIPHIILFNESPGGKSSMGTTGDSSLESWYSFLEGHQKNYYLPKIDQLLAAMLGASEGPVAGAPPEEWDWEFNKIQSMDEGAQADLEAKQYDNDGKAQALGIDSAMDTMQKRRPEKFKQMNVKPDKMLEASMQQMVRAQMEKFGDPTSMEATGGAGLDMSDPLYRTRDASPATSGPQNARGKKTKADEATDMLADDLVARLTAALAPMVGVRLDYNENHDEKGEFSSGPGGAGGSGKVIRIGQHLSESQANTLRNNTIRTENKLRASGGQGNYTQGSIKIEPGFKGPGQTTYHVTADIAAHRLSEEHANSYLQTPPRFVKSGSKEEFEKTVKTGHFTMMTAANPMSQDVTSADNSRRMIGAMKELAARGVKFTPMSGRYAKPDAKPHEGREPTLMVFHDDKFTEKDARDLGKKWTQTSIMHVNNGKATIYHTNGKHETLVQRSTGLDFDPKAANNYTGHQGNKFSFSFPDESWDNPEKE